MTGNGPTKTDKQSMPFTPTYAPDEGIDAIIRGDLYPKQYDLRNPPQAPTAYQPRTFEKMLELYRGGDRKKVDEFRARNTQRVSPEDLNYMAKDDLLAMRSAMLAEALESGKNAGIFTGDNYIQRSAEFPNGAAGVMESPLMRHWASNAFSPRSGISTNAHESIHKYLIELGINMPNGSEDQQDMYDTGTHHTLIDLLNERLTGEKNPNGFGKHYKDLLDSLEKSAQKDIGKKISKKNQGRISSR